MSRADEVMVLADVGASLGEGPTWDAPRGLVRWVDIDRGTLWAAPVPDGTPGEATVVLDVGPTLGAAVHTADGGLLLARTRHVEHRDAAGAVVGALPLVPPGVRSRLNDGACDPAGRYLVGSIAQDGRRGAERLWRVEHDGRVTVLDDDLTISNGLGWSPDGGTLYSVDTVPGRIHVRDYDPGTGRCGPRHLLADLPDLLPDGPPGALPDGLTVDADGNLWVAFWAGGQVRCLSPRGDVLAVVETGAPLTTSCAFVGPDLDLLAVTTAGQDAPGVTRTPRAGALLGVRPGVRGRPTTPWRPAPLPR